MDLRTKRRGLSQFCEGTIAAMVRGAKCDCPALLKTPPGTGSFLRSPRSKNVPVRLCRKPRRGLAHFCVVCGAKMCLSPSPRWGFLQSLPVPFSEAHGRKWFRFAFANRRRRSLSGLIFRLAELWTGQELDRGDLHPFFVAFRFWAGKGNQPSARHVLDALAYQTPNQLARIQS